MANLRIDTDQVTAVSQQMSRAVATIEGDILRLSEAVNQLEHEWSGDNSFAFVVDMRGTLSQLSEGLQSLETLGGRLLREAQKWEFMDQRGAANFEGAGQVDLMTPSGMPVSQKHSGPSLVESGSEKKLVETPVAQSAESPSTDVMTASEGGGEAAVAPEITPEQQEKWQMLSERGGFEDGVGPLHDQFPEGECTWYASSRRNFGYDVSGHAYKWADQAQVAGFEVGNIPAQGSVMVWQPGVHNAHMEYGHVSFVERVEKAMDGSFVVFFTDNANMNTDAPTRVTINPGEAGVSFIYGKTT